MRKIIVNGLDYFWSVKKTDKDFEYSISIKRGKKYTNFVFESSFGITPRLIMEYISINPELQKTEMSEEIKEKFLDAACTSFVRQSLKIS